MQALHGFYPSSKFLCLLLTLVRIKSLLQDHLFMHLYVVINNAFKFKKELLLQKPIICLQALYGLNCFEQAGVYQSVLKIRWKKLLLSVRLVSCCVNSAQPHNDRQDLLSELAYK